MKKEDMAYCGLNCENCKARFKDIQLKSKALVDALNAASFPEIVKMIPFMGFSYRGFNKILKFLNYDCPGCRNGGGNPFCGIRKCARKKDYFTCAECESLCKKFNKLFVVHPDNEIQDNIKGIRELGMDEFIIDEKTRTHWKNGVTS